MDFYQFRTKENHKTGITELYPGFTVGRSTDLMVRGGQFYAIWDEEKGLWSTDEYDVARLVDEEMYAFAKTQSEHGSRYIIRDMRNHESGSWTQFKKYISQISDTYHQLDQSLTFANTVVKKSDYVSRRLPYSLEPGDHSAWDELIGTLYSVEERAKLEWAVGAIISGDSKKIQKFLVLYGAPGSGKGTFLEIANKLFVGYAKAIDAKALGSSNAQFATDVFRSNPLFAYQQDGDLSNIQDNARLNSIVSHEIMTMNEKFKSSYDSHVNAMLILGTNKPVKISDAKSGIIRRLIDVHPTGASIPYNHYMTLVGRTDFELGAIASHCLDVYRSMGMNYYGNYRPLEMMLQTDPFFNFIEYNFDIFKEQDGVTLTQAYIMYKEYCSDSGFEKPMHRQKFQYELRNYFDDFKDRAEVDGHQVRSYYKGFNANKYKAPSKDGPAYSLVLEETESLLDNELADMPAQYAREDEFGDLIPEKRWVRVKTTLEDLDTSQLHFVKVPEQHIVIDFDLKDDQGNKSLELNLAAASVWPPTYAELSKGGAGVHLHYNYEGDVSELANVHSNGIEIKTLLGDASLRRKLTKCNSWEVAAMPINSGLPLKEKKKMMDARTIKSERSLRELIGRNLRKEIHPSTKSSIDFIKKILDDAYEAGLNYDVTDLRSKITAFANNSTNQPFQCLKIVMQMKFAGKDVVDGFGDDPISPDDPTVYQTEMNDNRLVIYDVEVYPNLFVICWKYAGDATIVRMINPKAHEVEELLKMKLVGFYNRRYDNHILYAAAQGYTIEELYKLSQKIIASKDQNAMFGSAYGLSYADVWDFLSIKTSLKKAMIDLGLPHIEMDIPWDQPVPPELVDKVVDYCCNDVLGTEAVLEDRKQDFVARQILADLSGLSVNDTTARHTARIIFGTDRNPQSSFKYTDLSKEFPGYEFDHGKSTYRGEVVGEGGYVYAEEGMYSDVVVLDIASMHPTTIEQLNVFGQYTPNFSALKEARLAIKRKDYDTAKKMLGGKLIPHLTNPADADALSYALKIVINIVYGLTSASFDNAFRDRRNKDNIVAKRGALFMIDLKHYVQEEMGLQVVHIKTDSIKIPGATAEQIQEVVNFGQKYGYDFEHEATYDRFCLVNDAVYIARVGWSPKAGKIGTWEAVGAQFQHPYVFKTLFSDEPIVFDDLCETKQVQKGALYLDFEHDTPMVTAKEGLKFVGKTGRFTPVEEGQNGAMLYRVVDDKYYSASGAKGYLWLESDMAAQSGAKIDMKYFEKLSDEAVKSIQKYGDFERFIS